MTSSLDAAVLALVGELDAIGDPVERFQAVRRVEQSLDEALRAVRQRIALQLKERMTWREVGERMGGVTAQRAEQISRGM